MPRIGNWTSLVSFRGKLNEDFSSPCIQEVKIEGWTASSEDNSFLSASIFLCHSTLPCKKILNSSDSHGGRIVWDDLNFPPPPHFAPVTVKRSFSFHVYDDWQQYSQTSTRRNYFISLLLLTGPARRSLRIVGCRTDEVIIRHRKFLAKPPTL